MIRVTIFTSSGCAYCRKAKHLLAKEKIPFYEIDSDIFQDRYEAASAAAGQMTVPIIFFGAQAVGGYTQLLQLQKEGRLKKLLVGPASSSEAPTSADTSGAESWLGELSTGEKRVLSAATKSSSSLFNELMEIMKVKIPFSNEEGYLVLSFKELSDTLHDPALSGLEIRDRGVLWRFKKCFTSQEILTALQRLSVADPASEAKQRCSLEAAAETARELMKRRMFLPVELFTDHENIRERMAASDSLQLDPINNKETLLKFQCDAETASLNTHFIAVSASSSLGCDFGWQRVSSELRWYLERILERYSDVDSDTIDYEGIKNSEIFSEFRDISTLLQLVRLEEMSDEEKVAFGINVYNICIIHGTIMRGTPQGWIDRYKFFNSVGYNIGGLHYSLGDIENGLLRGNRKGFGAFCRPFSSPSRDPRSALTVRNPDYRIHFALNCGAKSCPPISVFTADNLDNELQRAANAFLRNTSEFIAAKKTLRVSRIVSWYEADFEPDPAKIILSHLTVEDQDRIAVTCPSAMPKLEYLDYDWGSNDKNS